MRRRMSKWTKEIIIAAIRRQRAAGSDLTVMQMRRRESRLVEAAMRHFGSWRQAVEAAGFDYRLVRQVGKERRRRAITKWTSASITRELQRLWQLGEDARAGAVMVRRPGLYKAALKQYPHWRAVLEAAGIAPPSARPAAGAGGYGKRLWLQNLASQAAGRNPGAGAARDYRRAFRLASTIHAPDWLDRLTAGPAT